jgi:hypothetical protein
MMTVVRDGMWQAPARPRSRRPRKLASVKS